MTKKGVTQCRRGDGGVAGRAMLYGDGDDGDGDDDGDGGGDGDGGDGGRESNIIWKSKVRCQKISKRFYVCIEIFSHLFAKGKCILREN